MWAKICDSITARSSKTVTSLRDVIDGSMYKDLCREGRILHKNSNLTCTFNTDRVALYKSSRIEIWPIYVAINEIPPIERFLCKNIIMWGLWQGRGKPPTHVFVQPLVEEMMSLSVTGRLFVYIVILPSGHTTQNQR